MIIPFENDNPWDYLWSQFTLGFKSFQFYLHQSHRLTENNTAKIEVCDFSSS